MEFANEEKAKAKPGNGLRDEPEATTSEQPIDDVSLDENKETEIEPGKTISRRKAILTGLASAGVGVALGAAAFNANDEEGSAESGRPFDPTTAPLATSVTDDMSFNEAFGSARNETGPGGVFQWHGNYYNTFVVEEVDQHGVPLIEYSTIEQHPLPALTPYHEPSYNPQEVAQGEEEQPTSTQQPTQQEGATESSQEPEIVAVDMDGDGLPDAQYIDVNHDGVADGVLTDINHDGTIGAEEVEWMSNPEELSTTTGTVDTGILNVDADHDGVPEYILDDMDHDGQANIVPVDSDIIDVEPSTYAPPDVFEVGDEAVDLPADQLDNGYDPNLSNSDYDNAALGMDDIG